MSLPEAAGPACPDWGDWLEYHFETSELQAELRAHLSGCAPCRKTLADLQDRLSGAAAENQEPLPENFWENQRREIMARLPQTRVPVLRLWPAMAASILAALLGGALLWHSNRALTPMRSTEQDGRFLDAVLDRVSSSPSREWFEELTSDPDLRTVREISRVGDDL